MGPGAAGIVGLELIKGRTCKKCGGYKPLSGFYREPRAPDGAQSWCKSCHTKRNRKWRRDHPELTATYYRKSKLRRKYGQTPESYEALLRSQQGVCAICLAVCPTGRRLAVDHCHTTGAVRGLLCTNCNTSIGKFKDSPALLQAAILYLEKNLST